MDSALPRLGVVYRRVETLKPHPGNSREHPKSQLRRIGASLREFGAVKPLLIAGDTIVAGHGVWEAAKLCGIAELPTVDVSFLSADQIRAYLLADNKLATLSGWNPEKLAIELDYLISLDSLLDFSALGFEMPEVDAALGVTAGEDEELPILPRRTDAVTRPGQLWKIRKHRIVCGDARLPASYKALMAGKHASIIFSDPPYNLVIDGNVSGKGRKRHGEFAMGSGEMAPRQFQRFLQEVMRLFARSSELGAVHYLCMDWRHAFEITAAGKAIYPELLNVCVWAKPNAGMGSFYRGQFELVFVFKNAGGKHLNNIQLGKFGRHRSNLWAYASPNSVMQRDEEREIVMNHPTPKPVQMIADALLDASPRGGIVLDGFLGSGSTLMAAERTGRICYGIEIDPCYVDLAIRRFQLQTGEKAIDEVSGKSFDELAVERAGDVP